MGIENPNGHDHENGEPRWELLATPKASHPPGPIPHIPGASPELDAVLHHYYSMSPEERAAEEEAKQRGLARLKRMFEFDTPPAQTATEPITGYEQPRFTGEPFVDDEDN